MGEGVINRKIDKWILRNRQRGGRERGERE